MIRLLATAGILLVLPVSGAIAQTACGDDAMLTPCVGAQTGSSAGGETSSQSDNGSGTTGTVAPPVVTDDPLGMQTQSEDSLPPTRGTVDQRVTGSIPPPPTPMGMAPLTIPSDPLGSSIEPSIRNDVPTSGTTFGNPGIASPQ